MKIHYCWFGGKSKSPLICRCLESWRKYHPNDEIIEWNESNFDVNICPYVREAYQQKKYAFVSDYCRFFVLYNIGGCYLDTDVELIKPLIDLPENFVGFETGARYVASGLIRGAKKGDQICREMIQSYDSDVFVLSNGSINLKTVCVRETEILIRHGLIQKNQLQLVDGTYVFPTDYFCPLDNSTGELKITNNTYSIHHYSGTWLDEDMRQDLLNIREMKREALKLCQKSVLIPRPLAMGLMSLKYQGFLTTFQEVLKYISSRIG